MNRLPFALRDVVVELVRAGGKGSGFTVEVPGDDFNVMARELSEYAGLGWAQDGRSFKFHGITIRRSE